MYDKIRFELQIFHNVMRIFSAEFVGIIQSCLRMVVVLDLEWCMNENVVSFMIEFCITLVLYCFAGYFNSLVSSK